MKWLIDHTSTAKLMDIPPVPKNMVGLRKDGKRDRRYKSGKTYAELRAKLDEMGGK